MTPLVFLGGSSLLEGVGIVSACPEVLNDFKADFFEVDPFIVITFIPFHTYQVMAFASTRSGSKFEYSFNFTSAFRYFTKLFLVATWEVGLVVCDVRFDLADMEAIVDKRKSTVR